MEWFFLWVWFNGAIAVWTDGADIWPPIWKRIGASVTWPLVAGFYIVRNMIEQERAAKSREPEPIP